MPYEIQIFENEHFKSVRVIMIDGNPWFIGKDVAINLGYSNPQKAIRDHVDDDDKMVNESFTLGQGSSPLLINESGLYALILCSKLPKAKEFKHWVTYEVLPTIRKYGYYALPNAQVKPAKKSRKLSPKACVYAMLMSDGTVKIGYSGNVTNRRSNIQSKSELAVEKVYSSAPIPRKIARAIEKACHNFYSTSKMEGEFFSVKFEEVCRLIDTFIKHDEDLPLVTDFERADKVLEIVKMTTDLPDNKKEEKTLLIKAANIFVGETFD